MAKPLFFIGIPLSFEAYKTYENRQDAVERLAQACFDQNVDQLLDLRNEFEASDDDVLKAEVSTIDTVLSRIDTKP